jgi:transcription initiation factor TFIIB
MLVSRQVSLLNEDAYCKECHEKIVFAEDSGEQVCTSCGVVSDAPNGSIGYSPDYVAAMTNSTRREQPTSSMMYDLNLPTVIQSENLDANGRKIQGTYELAQLRRWNAYTISGESRRNNEVKAMREIDQIVGAVGLPNSVAREACEIYHRGLKNGTIRSKSITSMAAAAVLVAANLVGANCQQDEIERLKKTTSGNFIRRYHKLLLRNMNIRVTAMDPSRDVSRIAGKAGIKGKVERKSLEILAQVKDNAMLAGKRPASLAAGALYVASMQMGERTNQMRLAFAAGITPITIRKRSAEISMILNKMTISVEPSRVLQTQVGPRQDSVSPK